MSSRRQRAKRATAKSELILMGIAQAARASEIAEIVRKNKAQPMTRNFYASVQNSLALCEARGSRSGGGYAGKSMSNRKPSPRWKG